MRNLSQLLFFFSIFMSACSPEAPVQREDWHAINSCKSHSNTELCAMALSASREIDNLAGQSISFIETILSAETNGQVVLVSIDLRFQPRQRTTSTIKNQQEQLRARVCSSELGPQFLKQGGRYQFRNYQPDGNLFSEFAISNCFRNTERVTDLSTPRS